MRRARAEIRPACAGAVDSAVIPPAPPWFGSAPPYATSTLAQAARLPTRPVAIVAADNPAPYSDQRAPVGPSALPSSRRRGRPASEEGGDGGPPRRLRRADVRR